ncbi:hypothetical protein Tco_0981348 [Tanacetum coccineum]
MCSYLIFQDCIVIYLQVKLTILLACLYCQASTPLILGQIDMLVLTAIFDTFDVSLLLLMSDLDHFFDAYHPSWVPSNTNAMPLTPERRPHMARGKFFLPEVMDSGQHIRFEE